MKKNCLKCARVFYTKKDFFDNCFPCYRKQIELLKNLQFLSSSDDDDDVVVSVINKN